MKQDEQLDIQDDEIIAKAFKGSIIAFTVIAFCALIIWLFTRDSSEVNTVTNNIAVETPKTVSIDTTRVPPNATFEDISDGAGIKFIHNNGATGDKLLPETMGGGVAFFDYNNDGFQDLLLINSNDWNENSDSPKSSITLYKNQNGKHFVDVSNELGLTQQFYGMGVAIADYDGDGDGDIFITAVGHNLLLRNDNSYFTDVTKSAAVEGGKNEWSTSAAFFDADNDGDLDLFVANYVNWNRDIDFEVDYQLTGIGRAYGPPTNFAGQFARFYLNQGDGRFIDYSAQSGIQITSPELKKAIGKSLAIRPIDINNDQLIDLVVANDTVQNFVFENKGNGHFSEVAEIIGLAFDRNGHATGAMGIDAAWYLNDETLGFAIGNFANEMTSFYVGETESSYFSDQAIIDGIGPASRKALTFGVLFFDFDLDGYTDLFQANGHVESEINRVQSSQQYKQASQLFWNCGPSCNKPFINLELAADNPLASPMVGRGASFADIDNDGDLDLAITQIAGPARLLINQQNSNHQWLQIKLSQAGLNRDAIGAKVTLSLSSGEVLTRDIMPSRSYLSQVPAIAYFGLGPSPKIDAITITWPDGVKQTIDNNLALNKLHVISR